MKVAAFSAQPVVVFVLIAAVCHTSFGQTNKSKVPSPDSDALVLEDRLPSYDEMLATALKHHPDVRAADAELDRARLKVATDIRAFCEEWRAAKAVLSDVTAAQREFDRLSSLQEGTIAGKKLVEARYGLETAKKRAAAAEAKLKELGLLMPHLMGAAVVEKLTDEQRPGHAHHIAGDDHDHDHAIPAPVEKLLRERLQVLVELAQLQQDGYRQGEVDFEEVSSAQLDLLAARLELAKSTNERVKIRQEMLQVSKQIEVVTKQLFRANQTSQPGMLKATALRLRAEADLKREQLASDHHH